VNFSDLPKSVLNFSKCVLFAGEIVNLRVVLNVYMIPRLTFACREEKDESRGDVDHSRTRAEKRGVQNLQTMYLKTKLLLHGSKKIRRLGNHQGSLRSWKNLVERRIADAGNLFPVFSHTLICRQYGSRQNP
jgi:hypothetical protein